MELKTPLKIVSKTLSPMSSARVYDAVGNIRFDVTHLLGSELDFFEELVRRANAHDAMVEALKAINTATDPYPESENYRADDREGCLEYCFAASRDALATLAAAKGGGS